MPKATDWKNQIVGKLRVIAKDEKQSRLTGDIIWIAKCECGNERQISSRSLRTAKRNGSITSCGCASGQKRKKDWVGEKIGRLTISCQIGIKTYPGGQSSPLWTGICECGGERKVSSIDLRTALSQKINLSCDNCPKSQTLDLVGEKIGSIKVGNPSGNYIFPGGQTAPKFLCECICGNSKEFTSTTLRQASRDGYDLSCGCKSEEKRTKHIGKKIGRLFVLKRNETSQFYECKCICGASVEKTAFDLSRAEQTGATISCGCYFSSIKIGQKFGRLEVLNKKPAKKRADGKGSRGQWHCRCDCGNELNVESTNLTLGKVKSCGCYYNDGEFRFNAPFCYLKKICPRCNRDLDRNAFGKSKSRPGGLKSLCSKCSYEVKDYSKVIVSNVLRKERTKIATPIWVQTNQLIKVHSKRVELENEIGIKLHVDHIVPLNHSDVCGLNIPANLQITSARYNSSKQNMFVEAEVVDIDEQTLFEDGVRIHFSVFEEQ